MHRRKSYSHSERQEQPATHRRRCNMSDVEHCCRGFRTGGFPLGRLRRQHAADSGIVCLLDKDTWRSVSSYGRISSAVLRLVLFSSDQQYSLDCITYYTCLCVGGLLGLCTGNIVSSHVRAVDFEMWVTAFLIAGGLLMLSSTSMLASQLSAVVVVGTMLGTLLRPVARCCRRGGNADAESGTSPRLCLTVQRLMPPLISITQPRTAPRPPRAP